MLLVAHNSTSFTRPSAIKIAFILARYLGDLQYIVIYISLAAHNTPLFTRPKGPQNSLDLYGYILEKFHGFRVARCQVACFHTDNGSELYYFEVPALWNSEL